jgi:hypothetical protein
VIAGLPVADAGIAVMIDTPALTVNIVLPWYGVTVPLLPPNVIAVPPLVSDTCKVFAVELTT